MPLQCTPHRILKQPTMSSNPPVCMHLSNTCGTLLQLMLLKRLYDIWKPLPRPQPIPHTMITRISSIYDSCT